MYTIQYYAWEEFKCIAYPISVLKLIPLGVPVDYIPDTILYYVVEYLLNRPCPPLIYGGHMVQKYHG